MKSNVKKATIFVPISNSGVVTNNTILPVIKAHINNPNDLRELLEFYPTQFKNSAKYLSNKEKSLVKPIILEKEPDFQLEIKETAAKTLKNNIPEEHQMLNNILHNLYNLKGLKQLQESFPELFEKAVDYGITNLKQIKEGIKGA